MSGNHRWGLLVCVGLLGSFAAEPRESVGAASEGRRAVSRAASPNAPANKTHRVAWRNRPEPTALESPQSGLSSQPLSLAQLRELALANNKQIAVLGYAHRERATAIEQGRAAFDPEVGINAVGGKYDHQVRDLVQTLGAPAEAQQSDVFGAVDPNQVYLTERLTSGGRLTFGLATDYLNESPVGGLSTKNPSWDSALTLSIEQPLFKGRGRAVNTAPIAVARADTRQSFEAFQVEVHRLLYNVETAYWEAALDYRNLTFQQEVVARAGRTLEMARERLRLGQGSLLEVSQAEEQYELFRIQLLDAQNRMAVARNRLREIAGLPPYSRHPWVPSDSPSSAPVDIHWQTALASAMTRPELSAQRAAIQAAETKLMVAQNGTETDLSFQFDYAINGLERRLDDSLSTIGDTRYSDWTVGLVYRYPWGQRAEKALLRRQQLALCRERARFVELKHRIEHELAVAYENVTTHQRVLEGQRRRSDAAQQYLEATEELFVQGRVTMDHKLRAEARYASAILSANRAQIAYERTLVAWKLAGGTLLQQSVSFVEPQPPEESEPTPAPPAPRPIRLPDVRADLPKPPEPPTLENWSLANATGPTHRP